MLEQAFEEFDWRYERVRDVPYDDEATPSDRAQMTTRMSKALDVLRVGGKRIRPILEEALESRDVSTAAAAVYAARDVDPEWFIEERLGGLLQDRETLHAVRIGLRTFPIDGVEDRLRKEVEGGEPFARACLAELLAFHGRRPSDDFEELLDAEDPEIREMAIRAAGLGGRFEWIASRLDRDLMVEEEGLADSILDVSKRVHPPEMREAFLAHARERCARSKCAARLVGNLGDEADADVLIEALSESRERDSIEVAEAALDGLGALGRAKAIPTILALLRDPDLAPAAARAFVRITGASDLQAKESASRPDGTEPSRQHEGAEDAPVTDVDPACASLWWNEHRGDERFAFRTQRGQVVSASASGPEFVGEGQS